MVAHFGWLLVCDEKRVECVRERETRRVELEAQSRRVRQRDPLEVLLVFRADDDVLQRVCVAGS